MKQRLIAWYTLVVEEVLFEVFACYAQLSPLLWFTSSAQAIV